MALFFPWANVAASSGWSFRRGSIAGRIVPNVADTAGEGKKEYAKRPPGLNFLVDPARMTRSQLLAVDLHPSSFTLEPFALSLAPACHLLVILGPTASGKTRLSVETGFVRKTHTLAPSLIGDLAEQC
jgi:hypothetical protein